MKLKSALVVIGSFMGALMFALGLIFDEIDLLYGPICWSIMGVGVLLFFVCMIWGDVK